MFDIKNIDLSTAFPQTQIISEQKSIGAVTILTMPVGAQVVMQLGPSGQPFTVPGPGVFDGFDPETDGNHGLYFTNATNQPGVIIQIMVGYSTPNNSAPRVIQ